MNQGEQKVLNLQERYHTFRRNDEICRYGIFGMNREYFEVAHPLDEPAKRTVTLSIPAPKLRVMQAVITSKCNLKCAYCSFMANAPVSSAPEMSRAEIEDLCRKFNREIGSDGLLLITGGEPELYPDAVDYFLDNIDGKVIIFTNGTLSDRDRLLSYQKRRAGVLFSLDGDLFAQDSVRKGKHGSYNRVAAALKTAQTIGLDYGISAVVGDHNIEKLPELIAYIHQEFKPASLGLNLPHRFGDGVWTRIEEYTQALKQVFRYARRRDLFIDQLNRRLSPLVTGQFRFRDCAAQGEKIVAFPGGVALSCVNEAALEEPTFDWGYRIPLLNEQCSDCFAIAICGGGCIFDGEAIYGSRKFDERNCYFTREMLEYFIWDFRDELGESASDPAALAKKYGALIKRAKGTNFSVGHEAV
ncbi:hypothetical protein CEE37_09365 [candidate division LCP-89 bacterium B3_LCP]|uniref:Radical SAM core domain-containing protein n=1 Tax=candidate division LCP-89 bacterium B3_LCP TaxID=2012998 RepID=A0A532UYC8_UNCL8|nr:MAG: hypothetical protein CEE37_09365 [candidate division LCP-89 bacterium B3_LCP]